MSSTNKIHFKKKQIQGSIDNINRDGLSFEKRLIFRVFFFFFKGKRRLGPSSLVLSFVRWRAGENFESVESVHIRT